MYYVGQSLIMNAAVILLILMHHHPRAAIYLLIMFSHHFPLRALRQENGNLLWVVPAQAVFVIPGQL